MSQSTTTQTTNKHHHHGDGAAHPSSGMDSMIPRHPSGGWPCACLFQGRCLKGFDRINKINVEINIFIPTLCLIELGLVRWKQWWPKRHPLSLAAANNIRLD